VRKSRPTFLVIIVAIIFVVGLWLGNRLPGLFGSSKQIYSSVTLLEQVRTLSQLVTVEFNTATVVVAEDVKWYGESRVILQACGVVKAGIDLSQIRTNDIVVQTNQVIIRLPSAQITDCYLDDAQTKVIDRTTGLWRTFDKNLEQVTRKNAVDDIRRDARNRGILKKADEQARVLLANLFHQLGFTNIVFQPQITVPAPGQPQ